MTESIRIGIVGAGGNTTAQHIPKLQAIEGVRIQSVCNRSLASGQAVADIWEISDVFDSWQDLVTSDTIDAVVIGTWPDMHCPITLAALAADKHVMCEARIARTADEAQQMCAAARSKPQLIAQVVPAPFTFAFDTCIQRLLAEGYIGELLHIDVSFAGSTFLDRDEPMSWRQDSDMSGHNIMALGICYETVMRWCGEASSVCALGSCFVNQRRNQVGELQDISIPEHLDVLARMHNSASAHFRMSAVSGFAGESEYRMIGSDGTLIIRDGKLLGGLKSDKALHEIDIPDSEKSKWRVEEEFIAAIRGTEEIKLTSFEDGVRYMRFTDAVYNSLCSQRTEVIESYPVD